MTTGAVLLVLSALSAAALLFFAARLVLRRRAERARLNRIRAAVAQWLTADMATEPPPDVTELRPRDDPARPGGPASFGWFGSGPNGHLRSWSA
ncbi:hypothetical protein [Umezawaea sp. Da 62-37]|uniref:hypothetical protein n=1 Tax=Umezawaea sp. Da 62-37 TaxID=3075927 RepID=UPI0028F71A28|nr:hypothetical protein [Umezawaea sp. Da 62-37]WNV82664.1 hypothetical protein RM788_31260 [Umezawaea sp. Da 62-37]